MTSGLQKTYTNFSEARNFAHSLGLKSRAGWEEWVKSNKLPVDIPKHPSRIYAKKGWTNWGDFLGTGNRAPKDYNYRPFPEAHLFVRNLEIKNTTEWKKWANSDKRPQDIPKNPAQAYRKKGWINFADFLGTRVIANKRIFQLFAEARDFARSLRLRSKKDWLQWFEIHQPLDLPKWPNHLYKNAGWQGWNDFLGISTPPVNRGRKYRLSQNQDYCSFEKKLAQALIL